MKVVSLLLVIIGSVFLFKGLKPAKRIWRNVGGEQRMKWLVILILMTFFLFGYLLFDVVLFFNMPLPLAFVTSLVFLGGALFVFIIINLSERTITALQKAEENIRLSNESLEVRFEEKTKELKRLNDFNRVVLDSISDSISIIDIESFSILDANLAFLKEYNLTKEQVVGRKCYETTHQSPAPCSSAHGSCPLLETASSENHAKVEHVHRTAAGEVCHVEILTSPIRDEEGRVVRVVHIQRDITERKRAEAQLRESEQTYRNLFNNGEVGVFRSRLDGSEVLDVNRKYLEIVGRTREETIGNPSEILWADPKEREEMVRLLVENGRISGFEYKKLNRLDGKVRDCITSIVLYREEGIIEGSILDITERKQTEEVLQNKERYQRALLDNFPFLVWLKDKESRFLAVNQLFAKNCGVDDPDELVGKNDFDVWPHDLAEIYRRDDQEVLASRQKKIIEENIFDQSVPKWFETYKAPVIGRDGEQFGTVGFARDITDRKQAEAERLLFEQQMQNSQRLESLGVLAGGIAHDFNNILAVIMCYSSLGQNKPEKAPEFMPEIEKAASRAADLCRQMLAYAGKTQFVQSHVDVTELLDDMLSMLKATLPQNVAVKPYLTGDIPPIKADASQLRQIVMNMIINASEAIGEAQGEIRVALTKRTVESERPEKDHLGKAITPGPYICMEVTDNGCGMDDETKQRIFEPFYTTKFVGRGLGMSAVLGIITSHRGALQLYGQKGQGTTFKVFLPVQIDDSALEPPEQAHRSPWQGSGTILLVDDEEQILLVAKTLLEDLRFSVIEASNGIEAIEKYHKNAADITLVITDIGMPLMDGYELFRELKKIEPELPIIISSGFGESDVTSKIPQEDIAGLISKPYSFDQLREVLRGVVENTHGVRPND